MPEPLSSKTGLGMKVAVFPCSLATFFTTYLYHFIWSPISIIGEKRMSISACPAVATSWW